MPDNRHSRWANISTRELKTINAALALVSVRSNRDFAEQCQHLHRELNEVLAQRISETREIARQKVGEGANA